MEGAGWSAAAAPHMEGDGGMGAAVQQRAAARRDASSAARRTHITLPAPDWPLAARNEAKSREVTS